MLWLREFFFPILRHHIAIIRWCSGGVALCLHYTSGGTSLYRYSVFYVQYIMLLLVNQPVYNTIEKITTKHFSSGHNMILWLHNKLCEYCARSDTNKISWLPNRFHWLWIVCCAHNFSTLADAESVIDLGINGFGSLKLFPLTQPLVN